MLYLSCKSDYSICHEFKSNIRISNIYMKKNTFYFLLSLIYSKKTFFRLIINIRYFFYTYSQNTPH